MGELCFAFGSLICCCSYPFSRWYGTTAMTCFVHGIEIFVVLVMIETKMKILLYYFGFRVDLEVYYRHVVLTI